MSCQKDPERETTSLFIVNRKQILRFLTEADLNHQYLWDISMVLPRNGKSHSFPTHGRRWRRWRYAWHNHENGSENRHQNGETRKGNELSDEKILICIDVPNSSTTPRREMGGTEHGVAAKKM